MNPYVVIPDYNGWQFTRRCLDALELDGQAKIRVIVVDHGTSDDTRRGLEAEYPGVIRLAASSSLWWTGAVNRGIQHAMDLGARAVVLLNNDCYAEPGALRRLVEHNRSEPGAIIGALQTRLDSGRVQAPLSSCFLLGFPSLQLPGRHVHRADRRSLIRVGLIGGGRLVLIPTAVFDRVGRFDESALPHYYADHDFYLRCRKKKVPLRVATDVLVRVDDAQTTSAARLERLSFREFLDTLTNRRSHRNLKDLATLFKKHYPLKGMHYLGLAMNVSRYLAVYLWKRSVFLLTK